MRRSMITLAAFALVAAACGQYPGVHDRAVESGEIGSASGLSPVTAPEAGTEVIGPSGGAGGSGVAVESSGSAPGAPGTSTEQPEAAGGSGEGVVAPGEGAAPDR